MKECYSIYKQNNMNTSDSMKLVLMMYDGSINFLVKAIDYDEKGDMRNRNIYVNKANNIIIELDNAVNDKAGGELSKNLKWLYSFMNRHLSEAIQKEGSKALNDVASMLKNLRGGWQHVENCLHANGLEDSETAQVAVQ